MENLESLMKQREAVAKEISQLENQEKMILTKQKNEERRARNHRLIERGAMLESVFPELAACENSGVMAFLMATSRLPQIEELLAKAAKTDDAG